MAGQEPKRKAAAILILSKVKFPSSDDLYRAQVTATNGALPITVWLESLRTHHQWECDVTCFDEHKPLTAGYALPSEMILAALMSVLTNSSKRARGDNGVADSEHVEVDLKPAAASTDRLLLQLALQAFVGLRAEYTFEMLPRRREPLDALRSHVYAVQEAVDELKAQAHEFTEEVLSNAQVDWLSVATRTTTRTGAAVQWPLHARVPDHWVGFVDEECTTLTLKRSGLYHIQVSGPCSSFASELVLSVDDVRVAVAQAIKQDGATDDRKARTRLHLSHILSLDAHARFRIHVASGATCHHSKCAAAMCKKVKFGGVGGGRAELYVHVLGFTDTSGATATDCEC
ncbi:hypothetical protein H310_11126 [Aphanomyces invadans]|uniref:Uncharacterized protein n=1 Tax=Aphanomyces invadans TaxID=157072 RepID=A0A024TNX4_9STRA|nr:hypothetical protein H310_11126 [Aphanomyces invadans]ETV95709.1 hypothetical protein H310_11126 [Aphanomyces invadans]|eukprot:XP_008875902.1 hypothetical protein H310_11126 [Aphanomyces invadans]